MSGIHPLLTKRGEALSLSQLGYLCRMGGKALILNGPLPSQLAFTLPATALP